MRNASQLISDLAEFLDSQGRKSDPITVAGSRDYLRRFFKPSKRGGPLYAGTHPLVVIKPAKAQALDQAVLL